MSQVTRILSAIEQGDTSAAEQLLPLVYDELRALAAQKLAQEKPGQTPEAACADAADWSRRAGVAHGRSRTEVDEKKKPSRGLFSERAVPTSRHSPHTEIR